MTWLALSTSPVQYVDSAGAPYSGAVLKAYSSGTTTNINFSIDDAGGTTASSVALNAAGYPSVSGNVVVLHVEEKYKLALYATQAAADANSGAVWTIDELTAPVIAGANTDTIVRVSSNDTTSGYLNGKLVAGDNITFAEGSDGGNETLTLAALTGTITGDAVFAAGQGADFSANTGAAGETSSLLDWYEEGAWTPAVGGTATYTAQSGLYTRIGRLVHYEGYLVINVLGTGSPLSISGLPFSAVSGSNFPGTLLITASSAINITSSFGIVTGTTSAITIYAHQAAGAAAGQTNCMGDATAVRFGGCFHV